MQKYKKIIILTILFVLPTVLAQKEGSIHLLALVERGNQTFGGVAELHLTIAEGKGGVFLDTFPLTKFTTQISMRFAQQIACQELNIDCSNLNFFYTIRGAKGIVGGPSAGAAATVLTASLIKGLELNNSVAITGTINSGGMIGSVGGLKEKIQAAAEHNLSKVLIPKGTREQKENNSTIDMVKLGEKLGVEVIEVGTLEEALTQFSKNFVKKELPDFYIGENYKKLMKELSRELCSRVKVFPEKFEKYIKKALEQENYYSASSLCFRSVIEEKQKEYLNMSVKKQHIPFLKLMLAKKINKTEKELENIKVDTITSLQTLMSVKERIDEAKELAENIKEENLNESLKLLAFAEERLKSSILWSKFFEIKNDKTIVDKENLKNSCKNKIEESEERLQYMKEYIPLPFFKVERDLNKAYQVLDEDPITCLYLTSKTKAGINSVLGLLGVKEERIPEILEIKLQLAKKTLIRAQQKGFFPLISYTYYEYANSLKEFDKQSAILYVEYALEFASLDMYFSPEKISEEKIFIFSNLSLNSFIAGIGFGLLICGLLFLFHKIKPSQALQKKRLRGKKR